MQIMQIAHYDETPSCISPCRVTIILPGFAAREFVANLHLAVAEYPSQVR